MTRRTPFIAAGIIGAVAIAAGPALGGMHTSAPKTQPAPTRLSDPALTCSQLTARFIKYLGPGMQTQLTTFVSPAFVIERNDGSTDSWPTYLQNHPVFTGWNITIKTAQYSSPVLTCGALTSTTQLSADGTSDTSAPANNLSTFAWQRGAWRITSYARFNAIS